MYRVQVISRRSKMGSGVSVCFISFSLFLDYANYVRAFLVSGRYMYIGQSYAGYFLVSYISEGFYEHIYKGAQRNRKTNK